MSGNMSFSGIRNSTLLNSTNAVPLAALHPNSQTSLHQSRDLPGVVSASAPSYHDADLWSLRIILSSLQELVFSTSPNAKIPPTLLSTIQNVLISIRSELEPTNPLLKSSEVPLLANPHKGSHKAQPGLHGESLLGSTGGGIGPGAGLHNRSNLSMVTGDLTAVPSDARLIIRSMISINIRNLAKGIIKVYAPLLDKEGLVGVTLSDPAAEENRIHEALAGINKLLGKMKVDGQRLEREIQELKEERETEVHNYEHEIKEMEAIVSQLAEITVIENQTEKKACYLDHVKQGTENLALKQAVLALEQEIESNPPELMEELDEQYTKLKAVVDGLEKKNDKMKSTLSAYGAIGEDYKHLRCEYQQLIEDIKTKEWVLDQLSNGEWANKSLNESFF